MEVLLSLAAIIIMSIILYFKSKKIRVLKKKVYALNLESDESFLLEDQLLVENKFLKDKLSKHAIPISLDELKQYTHQMRLLEEEVA